MSASLCASVAPAVILFQVLSSVIALGRTTPASAFGFRGQQAEQVLQKASQNMGR